MSVNCTSKFRKLFKATTNSNYIKFSCVEVAAHKLLKLSMKIMIG
jgi:hypothetical protein